MPVMKTNCLLSYVTNLQLCAKIKYEKNVGNVLKYVSQQTHFFIKYGRRGKMKVNVKRRYSKELHQGGLEIPCMFSVSPEHEKMLHRFERYVKDVLSKKPKQNYKMICSLYNPTYVGAHYL